MNRKVSDPINSCRLGVAVVIDVVDMALFPYLSARRGLHSAVSQLTHKTVHLPPGNTPPI